MYSKFIHLKEWWLVKPYWLKGIILSIIGGIVWAFVYRVVNFFQEFFIAFFIILVSLAVVYWVGKNINKTNYSYKIKGAMFCGVLVFLLTMSFFVTAGGCSRFVAGLDGCSPVEALIDLGNILTAIIFTIPALLSGFIIGFIIEKIKNRA